MADDDLDRLLREVDASLSGTSSSGSVPATRSSSDVARPRGRFARAGRRGLVSGAVVGAGVFGVSFFFSWLPGDQNPVSTGFGAFVGGFLVAGWTALRQKS